MQNTPNEQYKGFSLFNDIEDKELRTRNRSVVMANMAEDHMDRKTKRVNVKGASLILNYFSFIPQEERDDAKQSFIKDMTSRGFALTT